MKTVTSYLPEGPKPQSGKKRMAAYCRVSSSSVEQIHSYMAQIDFYERLLKNDPTYEFAGIYADEGKTGTRADKRPEFLRLIEDCRAGLVNAVITKSVSRFGRNTVDTLEYTRELKNFGVDVFFEKENLHSISPDGELMLTLMAAFAESEAETMSENITWGKRKRFSGGNVGSIAVCNVFGYGKDESGEIAVREDEAPVVRRIFEEFLSGTNTQKIAEGLNADDIPTRREGAKWHNRTIIGILQNEKYSGDVLFQKRRTLGALNGTVWNNGELPQYYVEDGLPAIIDKRLWRITQLEYGRRAAMNLTQLSEKHPFAGRIFCGSCGEQVVQCDHRHKIWWRCSARIARFKRPSDIKHDKVRVPLGRPEHIFVQAWNLILSKRLQYEPRLKRKAESDESELARYHALEMLRLMDEKGKLEEFDYPLSLKVLDRMVLQLEGKLTVVFLAGIRMTL